MDCLSVIEGYMRGIPSVMYDDLDDVDDVLNCGLHTMHRDLDVLYRTLMEEKI